MAANTKLRSACDVCHALKIRCSGQIPCEGCLNTRNLCFYSYSSRLGRPKGTKNNKRKAGHEQRTGHTDRPDVEKDTSSDRPPKLSSPRPIDHQKCPPSAPSVTDDFVTSVPVIDNSLLEQIPENDVYTLNDAELQSPQAVEGQNYEFSDYFSLDGGTQAHFETILQVGEPSG